MATDKHIFRKNEREKFRRDGGGTRRLENEAKFMFQRMCLGGFCSPLCPGADTGLLEWAVSSEIEADVRGSCSKVALARRGRLAWRPASRRPIHHVVLLD